MLTQRVKPPDRDRSERQAPAPPRPLAQLLTRLEAGLPEHRFRSRLPWARAVTIAPRKKVDVVSTAL